jgi:hypothetical protein
VVVEVADRCIRSVGALSWATLGAVETPHPSRGRPRPTVIPDARSSSVATPGIRGLPTGVGPVLRFANLETRDAELGAGACAERAYSDYRVVAEAVAEWLRVSGECDHRRTGCVPSNCGLERNRRRG